MSESVPVPVYDPCVLGADGQCTRWSHDHLCDPSVPVPVTDSRPEVVIPGTDYLLLDSLQDLLDAAISWRATWITQDSDGRRLVYVNDGTAEQAERVLLLAAAKYAEDVRDNLAEMEEEDHA